MIFYFTGTGNSLFAAKRLLQSGEELISIAEAIKKNRYSFKVPAGENVGFVFPVYFYTVPEIIRSFISRLSLEGAEYTYSVITCGGGISRSGAVLKKLLAGRGITLNFVQSLLMPDNSMLFYQIPGMEDAERKLRAAEGLLAEIKRKITARESCDPGASTLVSDLSGLGFRLCNKTAGFYAGDECTGCGLCAANCPQDVIIMSGGRPQWSKSVCQKCSACINRCPVQAIQYGKATIKRRRYVNPEL